jgi:hypothetical protein
MERDVTKPRDEPRTTGETAARAEDRRRRLAAQLRANLARRKRQLRERAAGNEPASEPLEPDGE